MTYTTNSRSRVINAFDAILENANDDDVLELRDALDVYRTTNARSMPRLMQCAILREIFASCDDAADDVDYRNRRDEDKAMLHVDDVSDIASRYVDLCNV
jgi:hypothetical protein